MVKGFIPKDRGKLVKWLLETAASNSWKIVLEYSSPNMRTFLTEYATEITLPFTVKHHYAQEYELSAIVNPRVTTRFVSRLIKKYSVLSVHNRTEMLMLCADDFHLECFTCSEVFYETYYSVLLKQDLVF